MKAIYTIIETAQQDTDRFFQGTCSIKVFPGITMSNKDGAITWCHHIICAVTPKAMDHKRTETIMFFADHDYRMHFRRWEGWRSGPDDDGTVDNYEASEVPGSRLKGRMDVEACIDRFRNKADNYHYVQVAKEDFDAEVQKIIASNPHLAVELVEDCENIHEKI
jgi:hypothetical protein